jgi:hypothetical protein
MTQIHNGKALVNFEIKKALIELIETDMQQKLQTVNEIT